MGPGRWSRRGAASFLLRDPDSRAALLGDASDDLGIVATMSVRELHGLELLVHGSDPRRSHTEDASSVARCHQVLWDHHLRLAHVTSSGRISRECFGQFLNSRLQRRRSARARSVPTRNGITCKPMEATGAARAELQRRKPPDSRRLRTNREDSRACSGDPRSTIQVPLGSRSLLDQPLPSRG